ncbi:MAG: DNA polymerase IV [Pseudomonadota bacterium]
MDVVHRLCRSCLTVNGLSNGERCGVCGSPRVVEHEELLDLTIAHIDCDAFYAAVEKRDNPSLADQPVIVGGGTRGVVTTCCYLARIHGVRSAMPMFKARKLCPDAQIIKPRMHRYAEVGQKVRAMMLALTPMVEPLSIDEAFLDLSGTQKLHNASPALSLGRFARDVEEQIGISVSIGLSYNKSMAKMASDRDKPRGFTVIGKRESTAFLAPQSVRALFGVGEAMAGKLEAAGYRTLSDLQEADTSALMRKFGEHGLHLRDLASGIDPRPVRPERGRKSVSSERTFSEDVSELEALRVHARASCERVSQQLKDKQLAGRTVTLKIKTARFKTVSRAHSLDRPTQSADRLFGTADALLRPLADGTPYRLLGVGISDLHAGEDADDRDLADDGAMKRSQAEAAMDRVRGRFGREAVQVGLLMPQPTKASPAGYSGQADGRKAVKSDSTPRNENEP